MHLFGQSRGEICINLNFQPTKPSTRSSGPPKHAAEDPVEPTGGNQRKRKRKTKKTRCTRVDAPPHPILPRQILAFSHSFICKGRVLSMNTSFVLVSRHLQNQKSRKLSDKVDRIMAEEILDPY
jgi:hypothetical protein